MFPLLYALKVCTNKHMCKSCKLATGQKKGFNFILVVFKLSEEGISISIFKW